jgi:molybdopterin molybdotransferase
MITVDEAMRIVLAHAIQTPTRQVALGSAMGRVLREPLAADRPFPPFDRVTMDGIAIQYEAFASGRRRFRIQETGAAGAPRAILRDPGDCVEIMTGAILPEHTDTVIRYEDLRIDNGVAAVEIELVREGQNIHRKGIDRQAGEFIVSPGAMLGPAEIGVAATVGKHQLLVSDFPATIIVSSGDELVSVEARPLPHQIRKSNESRLQATLAAWGISADTEHLVDDPRAIREKLARFFQHYQVLILSGGVSAGKYDYIPQALEELGVCRLFHKIRQRPGKPFWFGIHPNGAAVFALPGNPVSSFLCTLRYFYPWMRASLGLPPPMPRYAVLAADIHFMPDLTYFAQARLEYAPEGRTLAHPVEGHGSGDLANLVDADTFIELPRERSHFKSGEVYPIWPFRHD